VQLLSARPARHDDAGTLEHAQVLHDTEPRHRQLRLELRQRATVTFEEQIEKESACRIRDCLEHRIIVEHAEIICDHMVTCQSGQVFYTSDPQRWIGC
jgi:hypothetical protein